MRKLNILTLFALTSFFACRGPEGSPGPPGPKGDDGGLVFSITDEFIFNFNRQTFDFLYEFPDDYNSEVFESDAVLAYFLWEVDGDLEIWRQLPITLFLNEGILLYAFDHTYADVMFFMDGNFPLETLDNVWFNEWVARIVIVPSEYALDAINAGVDLNDLHETAAFFNKEVPKSKYSLKKNHGLKEKMRSMGVE